MRSGVRWADTIVSSQGTPNSRRTSSAAFMVGRSESEPMMMPTCWVYYTMLGLGFKYIRLLGFYYIILYCREHRELSRDPETGQQTGACSTHACMCGPARHIGRGSTADITPGRRHHHCHHHQPQVQCPAQGLLPPQQRLMPPKPPRLTHPGLAAQRALTPCQPLQC
jgi:hypothetical protein